MNLNVELPKVFSVRDDHEFYPIQHLLGRLSPELHVAQIATGVHINGGFTVFWGLVYAEDHPPSVDEIESALREGGFDFDHNGSVRLPDFKAITAAVAAEGNGVHT